MKINFHLQVHLKLNLDQTLLRYLLDAGQYRRVFLDYEMKSRDENSKSSTHYFCVLSFYQLSQLLSINSSNDYALVGHRYCKNQKYHWLYPKIYLKDSEGKECIGCVLNENNNATLEIVYADLFREDRDVNSLIHIHMCLILSILVALGIMYFQRSHSICLLVK